MIAVARVLYENHRSEPKAFGPHALVCALVDDHLGLPGARVAQTLIDCVPRKGRDKLLRDCRESAEQIFAPLPREARFAVIDGDELHAVAGLGLAADATLEARRAALGRCYPGVTFVVPDADRPGDSNTEGLLRLIARCLELAPGDPLVVGALKKRLIERDRLFHRAANAQPAIRACILASQPSLAALVEALAVLVRLALGPADV